MYKLERSAFQSFPSSKNLFQKVNSALLIDNENFCEFLTFQQFVDFPVFLITYNYHWNFPKIVEKKLEQFIDKLKKCELKPQPEIFLTFKTKHSHIVINLYDD